MNTRRPTHGGYPTPDTVPPYRIRLVGDRYDREVTNAILHVASEFPGAQQVLIDVAHTDADDAPTHTISLPCWVAGNHPLWLPSLRRVLRAHER